MALMKIIIVDDERLARERLRVLLSRCPDVEIVAECASGPDAVKAIDSNPCDLVFLDIRMPEMDGFEVLDALGAARGFDVVFLTAHSEHAIRAFETRALDYLLKPVSSGRLRETLDRARERVQGHEPVRRLVVKESGQIVFIPIASLERVESAGNYAVLHTGGKTHIIRETMAALEQFLAADGFIRASRLAILNPDFIREIKKSDPWPVCIMSDGSKITVKRPLKEMTARFRQ